MSTAFIVLLAIYLAGVIFNFVKLMLWNKADNVNYTGFADYVTAAIFSLSSWLFWIACGSSWAVYYTSKFWKWLKKKLTK